MTGTYFHKVKKNVRIFVRMKREIWLDFLRVTACFLVMTVHATEPFYLGGDGTLVLSPADAFWVSLFEGLARCCVPLFVIASGYLQLPLHYSTGEFFRFSVLNKNGLKVIVITLAEALLASVLVFVLTFFILKLNFAFCHGNDTHST